MVKQINNSDKIQEKQRMAAAALLLAEALADYSHPSFTDRHGMADRLRKFFKEHKAALEPQRR